MTTAAEVGRIRRAQVVNLSITELMLLLVFMSLTFSFLAREEGLHDVPFVQKQLDETLARNAELRKQVQDLLRQNEVDKARIASLVQYLNDINVDPVTLRPKAGVPDNLTDAQLRALLASQEKVVAELQRENAELRKLSGGKAPGLPRCVVTSGFLLSFTFLPDGRISGVRAWDQGAAITAPGLPGISDLASERPLTAAEFSAAAASLNHWADTQTQPCRFPVLARRETTDAALFDRQLAAVESYFYVRRLR